MALELFNIRNKLIASAKKHQGFSLVEALLVLVIVSIVSITVFTIFLLPFKTQAKANNYQEADLDASLYALEKSNEGSVDADGDGNYDDVPDGCTVNAEDINLGVYTITCTRGNYDVKATAISNIYTQKIDIFGGDYQDLNRDGYEDTTGFPTHYDHCYSGQKGPEGQGSAGQFNNAVCTIGGIYIIPFFEDLY